MIGNSEGNEFQAMGPLYAKQFCPCFVLRRGGLYLIHNCKMIFLLQMYSHEEGSKTNWGLIIHSFIDYACRFLMGHFIYTRQPKTLGNPILMLAKVLFHTSR